MIDKISIIDHLKRYPNVNPISHFEAVYEKYKDYEMLEDLERIAENLAKGEKNCQRFYMLQFWYEFAVLNKYMKPSLSCVYFASLPSATIFGRDFTEKLMSDKLIEISSYLKKNSPNALRLLNFVRKCNKVATNNLEKKLQLGWKTIEGKTKRRWFGRRNMNIRISYYPNMNHERYYKQRPFTLLKMLFQSDYSIFQRKTFFENVKGKNSINFKVPPEQEFYVRTSNSREFYTFPLRLLNLFPKFQKISIFVPAMENFVNVKILDDEMTMKESLQMCNKKKYMWIYRASEDDQFVDFDYSQVLTDSRILSSSDHKVLAVYESSQVFDLGNKLFEHSFLTTPQLFVKKPTLSISYGKMCVLYENSEPVFIFFVTDGIVKKFQYIGEIRAEWETFAECFRLFSKRFPLRISENLNIPEKFLEIECEESELGQKLKKRSIQPFFSSETCTRKIKDQQFDVIEYIELF